MNVARPPSGRPTTREHGTSETGLGFDFDFTEFFKAAAPVATNIYAQKAQIDAQKRAAMMPAYYPPPGYAPGRGGVMSSMPTWVMPAAMVGGLGLLALVLLRK